MIGGLDHLGGVELCLLLGLLPALATCALAARGRIRPAWALWPLVLLAAGWHRAAFDAQPHLTEKWDATTMTWMRTLEARGLVGAVGAILALPMTWALTRRASRALLTAALGAPHVGMFVSSALLFYALREIARSPAEGRVGPLVDAIATAQLPLWIGAGVGAAAALVLAWRR